MRIACDDDWNIIRSMPWFHRMAVLLLSWLAHVCSGANANVALDWNAVMMAGIRSDTTSPTLSSRNLAILHLAIYDTVNSIARTHQPYQFQLTPPADASLDAAVMGAGYEILSVLYPSLRTRADDLYVAWRSAAPATPAVTNSLAFGKHIAELILAARANDGSATDVPYIPSAVPGQWRRTPPYFRPPLTPQWRHVKPFAIPNLEAFAPPPPPALNSAEYAESFNEVKRLGEKSSTNRTAEQTQIAVFWSDFSYTAMPPGHWHEIASTIANSKGTGLIECARLMALLSLAHADCAIACWEAKFKYNLWRPVTAIQRANEDDNPATEAAAGWDHLLASPPFPAYTSGHSTFSKASSEILAYFYGTDALSFTAGSDSLPGVFRSFKSVSACADEVGMSRIYGGIHYQFDNVAGKAIGKKIGNYIAANYLLANNQLPLVKVDEGSKEGKRLRLHGHIGAPIVLEVSTKTNQWKSISTNVAVAGGVSVAAPSEVTDLRSVRVRELGK